MGKNVNRRNLLELPFEQKIEVLKSLKGGQIAIVASMPNECMHTRTFSEYVGRIALELGVPVGTTPDTPYYYKTQYFQPTNQNQLIIGKRPGH